MKSGSKREAYGARPDRRRLTMSGRMPTAGGEATRGLLLEMATMLPSSSQTIVSGSPLSRAREMESMGAKAAASARNAGLEAVVTKARESSESKPGRGPRRPASRWSKVIRLRAPRKNTL